MNKRYQILNRITGWLLLLLVYSLSTLSCSDESFIGDENGKQVENRMPVRLTINTPATQKPDTRNMNLEEHIEEVRILVLSKPAAESEYQFLYSVEGANISYPNNHTTTFTAMLKSSDNPIKLILITNAGQTIAEKYPEAGDTETK